MKQQGVWFKATASNNSSGCVEVMFVGDNVHMRNSRDPNGSVLVFTRHEWSCFEDGAQKGEFAQPPAE